MPKDVELMYRYAAITFFSDEERPDVLDFSYTNEKLAWWRKEASLRDFFSQTALQELIPYLSFAQENLESFNLINQEFNQEFFSRIHSSLSSKQQMRLNALKDSFAADPTIISSKI